MLMNELIQSSVVVRLASFDRLASIQMASEAISPASNEARRASSSPPSFIWPVCVHPKWPRKGFHQRQMKLGGLVGADYVDERNTPDSRRARFIGPR